MREFASAIARTRTSPTYPGRRVRAQCPSQCRGCANLKELAKNAKNSENTRKTRSYKKSAQPPPATRDGGGVGVTCRARAGAERPCSVLHGCLRSRVRAAHALVHHLCHAWCRGNPTPRVPKRAHGRTTCHSVAGIAADAWVAPFSLCSGQTMSKRKADEQNGR